MKRISKSGVVKSGFLAFALLALGGCVYDPGYGYVRGDGYSGDAYYGTEYYGSSGYYDNDPWDYPYYGYGFGPAFGLGFYYDNYHRRHYYHGPHGGWGGGGWHGGDGYGYGHGGYYGHSEHAMPSHASGGHMSAPAHPSSRGTH